MSQTPQAGTGDSVSRFAVMTALLSSTMTAIFSCVNFFAFNCYVCTTQILGFLPSIQNVRPLSTQCRSLSVFTLWDALRYLYLQVSAQRFEPGGFIEPRRFRIIFPQVDTWPISRWPSRPIWDEIPTTILQSWFVTTPSWRRTFSKISSLLNLLCTATTQLNLLEILLRLVRAFDQGSLKAVLRLFRSTCESYRWSIPLSLVETVCVCVCVCVCEGSHWGLSRSRISQSLLRLNNTWRHTSSISLIESLVDQASFKVFLWLSMKHLSKFFLRLFGSTCESCRFWEILVGFVRALTNDSTYCAESFAGSNFARTDPAEDARKQHRNTGGSPQRWQRSTLLSKEMWAQGCEMSDVRCQMSDSRCLMSDVW